MNPSPKPVPQPPISEAYKRWLEIKAANPGLSDYRTANLLHSEGIRYSVTNLLEYAAALTTSAPAAPPQPQSPELAVSESLQPPPGKLGEVGKLPTDGVADYTLKQIGEALGITTQEARLLLNGDPATRKGSSADFPSASLVRKQGFGETWSLNLESLRAWHLAYSTPPNPST